MAPHCTALPIRRPELVVRPFGTDGQYVVKHPRSGEFFHLGAEEHFLLMQLDGRKDAAAVCLAFEQQFGQSLSEEELDEFIELARGQGLLQPASGVASAPREVAALPEEHPALTQPGSPARQSILYWRKNLFDPDRLFDRLEPRVRFFWTPAFLVFSVVCIVLALVLVAVNREQLVSSFARSLRWETALWAWVLLLVVTTLHEFAHGLTCKHHGGEVHEIGFLLLFFMPCFYCNVSDAWLFKEKSKRLWVTFAGAYFELFVWALAVFLWRLTWSDSLVHQLAFVVMSLCGIQTLVNLNPLIKLDGYYLLSDWLEVPNLQQRALGYFKGRLRWLLWGAARPLTPTPLPRGERGKEGPPLPRGERGRGEGEPHGRVLLLYGLASWTYSLGFLVVMLVAVGQLVGTDWGWLGLGAMALLGFVSLRGLFHDVFAGEVTNMLRFRQRRTLLWLLGLGGVIALCFVEMEDWESGPFQVRAAVRAELRAGAAGFVREVYCDEGGAVSPGAAVVQLEVPDLAMRTAQKQAEVRESRAKLRLLEAGSRPEEIDEQHRRVERSRTWQTLARQDLKRTEQAHQAELARLEKQTAAARAELEAAHDAYERARTLRGRNALGEEAYREAERKQRVSRAQLEQAEAARRAQEARGTLEAEAELARRTKELADAEAALRLLRAGTRPEEIDAERARLARLQEEARYLEQLPDRLRVTSPAHGVLTTPRLREKVGQYVREGDLIGVVEGPAGLEVELALAEEDVARVQVGQRVTLKVRALPFRTFQARVDRLAATAGCRDAQSVVTAYCLLEDADPAVRSGMTGSARISTGRRPVGMVALDRAVRLLRTEFWLWW